MFFKRKLEIIFLFVALITILFPSYGSPDFRYSGSDPNFDVWNYGWPFVFAIYDERFGLQIFLLGYYVIFLVTLYLIAHLIKSFILKKVSSKNT